MAGRPPKPKTPLPTPEVAPAPWQIPGKPLMRSGLGQGTGSLPRYPDAEALQEAIDAYFDRQIEDNEPPTVAGLSLALGFKGRTWMQRYIDKDEEFAEVVEVALTRMEDIKNRMLLKMEKGMSPQGVIFDLKNNHGWADKQETVTKTEVGDTLAALIMSLQGKVLRPVLDSDDKKAVDGEYRVLKDEDAPKRGIPDDLEGLI